MDLESWYGGKVKIPTKFDSYLGVFCASGAGIVVHTLDARGRVKFEMSNEAQTAYADIRQNKIVLPRRLLRPDGMQDILDRKITAVEAATISIGFMVHEAMHLRCSREILNYEDEFRENRAFAMMFNIVEDVFIEYIVEKQFYTLFWAIESLWDTFFPELKGDEGKVGFLITLKNRKLDTSFLDEGPAKERDILYEVLDEKMTFEGRIDVAKRLLDELPEYEVEMLEQMAEALSRANGSDEGDFVGKTMQVGSEEFMEALKKAIRSYDDYEGSELKELFELIGDETIDQYYEKNKYTDIFTPPKVSPGFDIDTRYYDLSRISKARAVVNHPYGEQKRSGNRVRQLYRIGIPGDGRIFAQPVDLSLPGKQEFIILVDCSGSMGGIVNRLVKDRVTRVDAALSAAIGAAYGIDSGGHYSAVFGHTADVISFPDDTGHVRLYKFKAYNETYEAFSQRARGFRSARDYDTPFRMVENRDGDAIREVVKQFTRKQNRKSLIVISDGDPSANGYRGRPAIADTARAVAEARAKGIKVMSISVTMDTHNDDIYGAANNVQNSDPGCIAKIIETLMKG